MKFKHAYTHLLYPARHSSFDGQNSRSIFFCLEWAEDLALHEGQVFFFFEKIVVEGHVSKKTTKHSKAATDQEQSDFTICTGCGVASSWEIKVAVGGGEVAFRACLGKLCTDMICLLERFEAAPSPPTNPRKRRLNTHPRRPAHPKYLFLFSILRNTRPP